MYFLKQWEFGLHEHEQLDALCVIQENGVAKELRLTANCCHLFRLFHVFLAYLRLSRSLVLT